MFKARALAILVILCGIAIEIFMSLGVVTGVADRACALVLAGYCVATAMLFKQFWVPGDCWAPEERVDRDYSWDFTKTSSSPTGCRSSRRGVCCFDKCMMTNSDKPSTH